MLLFGKCQHAISNKEFQIKNVLFMHVTSINKTTDGSSIDRRSVDFFYHQRHGKYLSLRMVSSLCQTIDQQYCLSFHLWSIDATLLHYTSITQISGTGTLESQRMVHQYGPPIDQRTVDANRGSTLSMTFLISSDD